MLERFEKEKENERRPRAHGAIGLGQPWHANGPAYFGLSQVTYFGTHGWTREKVLSK